MDRKTASDILVNAIKQITGPPYRSHVFQVHDEFRFLDDLNEWPTVCITPNFDQFHHSLSGERYSRLGFDIRAYVFSDMDVIEAEEALADDIEEALGGITELQDIRIHEIEMDEGLNSPFGVLIMRVSVLFLR